MPRGDFRKRESKKPRKKDAKSEVISSLILPSTEVELIKKKRKKPKDENL